MKKALDINERLKKLVFAAMFAALTCVATMVIQIPSPMGGYVNLGDCFVLLCGILLGNAWGFIASGLGSMLADIITGYTYYAPGTFIIKGMMALSVILIFRSMSKIFKRGISYIVASTVAEIIMIMGYFGYASLVLGKGISAATSISGNIVQGVFGVISSYLLFSNFESRLSSGAWLK